MEATTTESQVESTNTETNNAQTPVTDDIKKQDVPATATTTDGAPLAMQPGERGNWPLTKNKRKGGDKNKEKDRKKQKRQQKKDQQNNNNNNSNETKDKQEDADEDDEADQDAQGKPNPIRKRKVAVVLGYSGIGYQGLQRNPGAVTIEDVLEKAIHAAGGIADSNLGQFTKVSWMRACRTDKGVGAIGNVVSLKAMLPENFLQKLNESLPENIRVFGVQRALNGFHAKNAVDYRIYEYVYPTYGLKPILQNSNADWKFDSNMHEWVNRLCKMYEGTHNFWNLTVDKKYTDATSIRYLRKVTCSEPFEVQGIQFVRFTLVGQSFILHQIRKMIGLILLMVRYTAPDNVILNAFGPKSLNVPMAPGEFLCLDKCVFNSYNRKLKSLGSEYAPLDLDDWKKEREEFKFNEIYKNMVEAELKDKIVADFTSKLNKWSPKQDGQQYDVYEWFKLQKEVDPKVLEAIEKSKQKQLLKSQENAEKDQEFWKGV